MARSTKLLLALGSLLLLVLILFGLSLTRSGPGSDALDEGETASRTAASEPEARCAAPATYDKIKRELFRQAATARGADLAVYDRLAGYAAVRVADPVLREENEGEEQLSCSGTVSLDLPPGVQVEGGRRSLSAKLGYTLQPAADASGDVVTLTGAEGLVRQLATLSRSGQAAASAQVPNTDSLAQSDGNVPPPGEAPLQQPAQREDAPSPPQAPPAPQAPPQVAPARVSASPSFNCARASNRAERAVCGNAALASLDRAMSSRFFSARQEANATQRALLDRTRGSFLAFRNRCGSDACIADAYRGRIREINDIMADRWVAPR